MTRRQPSTGGRPSKGDRALLVTRVPIPVSDRVRAIADERDWTYSDTLAALIDIALRHPDELPAPDQQEELPLSQAS